MSEVYMNNGDLAVDIAKTDVEIPIPLAPGVAINGTWTASNSSNVLIITRTSATQTDYYKVPIPIIGRTTASKGMKLKSVKVSYSMNQTDSGDDLEIHIVKQTLPANGSTASAAILAGDADGDYDADHNTLAERILDTAAPQLHTAVVTIPTGEQAYLATGEQLYLEVKFADQSGADADLILTGAVATFDSALY